MWQATWQERKHLRTWTWNRLWGPRRSQLWCLIQITQRRQNHQTHMLTWQQGKNKSSLGRGSRVFLRRKKQPLQITCAPFHVLLNFRRMTQISRTCSACSVTSLKWALGRFHTRTVGRIQKHLPPTFGLVQLHAAQSRPGRSRSYISCSSTVAWN